MFLAVKGFLRTIVCTGYADYPIILDIIIIF